MLVESGMFPSLIQAYEECELTVGTRRVKRNIIGGL
jgi:hypothetical protein